jgi:hypothetical protein
MEIAMTTENEARILDMEVAMTTENEGSIFDPDNSLIGAIYAGEKRAKSIFCPEEQIKSLRITMEFDESGDLKSYWEVALDDKGNVLPWEWQRAAIDGL